jgi:hypothetical protein
VLLLVKLPVSLYVSAQPPEIVPWFVKLPEGHVVAEPVIVLGFEGEEAIIAPSFEKMNEFTFTFTLPKQHV